MSDIRKGQIVEGEITGITKYGIFLKFEDHYTGLIHISEISDGFVSDINNMYSIGSVIRAKIMEIDEDKLHLKLSIKRINPHVKKKNKRIPEKGRGFLPLKEKMEEWVNEKILEINEKN